MCTEAREDRYQRTHTYICTYRNTYWALLFSQLQPTAAQSSKQSYWKGWESKDTTQTRAAPLGHEHPSGLCFPGTASGAGLHSKFSCLVLFNFFIKAWISKGQLFFFLDNNKKIVFSSRVNLSFGVSSNSKLFPTFDIVKLGLLFRQDTESWSLQLDEESYSLKEYGGLCGWSLGFLISSLAAQAHFAFLLNHISAREKIL